MVALIQAFMRKDYEPVKELSSKVPVYISRRSITSRTKALRRRQKKIKGLLITDLNIATEARESARGNVYSIGWPLLATGANISSQDQKASGTGKDLSVKHELDVNPLQQTRATTVVKHSSLFQSGNEGQAKEVGMPNIEAQRSFNGGVDLSVQQSCRSKLPLIVIRSQSVCPCAEYKPRRMSKTQLVCHLSKSRPGRRSPTKKPRKFFRFRWDSFQMERRTVDQAYTRSKNLSPRVEHGHIANVDAQSGAREQMGSKTQVDIFRPASIPEQWVQRMWPSHLNVVAGTLQSIYERNFRCDANANVARLPVGPPAYIVSTPATALPCMLTFCLGATLVIFA